MKQVSNLRYKELQQSRILHDSLFNIHEIAYEIKDFVWKITTYPDLVCIFGMRRLLDELEEVLYLRCEGQLLSYYTTFQLGDFYLSTLLFRHVIFTQKPCIHIDFVQMQQTLLPSITKSTSTPFFTDRETSIASATEKLSDMLHRILLSHVHCLVMYLLRLPMEI